ncbi:coiled-coil domain-containing protein 192 isoform X7 [Canis aureus]
MGECYSRKSVAPGSETPERSSITSASSESNTQQRNKIPIQLFCSTTPNPSQHHQKESLETRQMAFTLAQFEALEICLKEAEEKAKSLSEQLAASEGTKSKLLEQVSWLEGKLQALDHKEDSGESYQKIVLAKDQHIEKLQAELKTSQEQLTAHKLKHKRKLKKLQTDLATAKQEAAITVLELNEKIRTLCEGKPAPRDTAPIKQCCLFQLILDSAVQRGTTGCLAVFLLSPMKLRAVSCSPPDCPTQLSTHQKTTLGKSPMAVSRLWKKVIENLT